MNLHELDQLLRTKTEIERLQQQNNQVINDLSEESEDERYYDVNQNMYRMPALFFFGEHDIYISKHNRFAPMLEHMHEFIELNYVYSGKCNQIIAGKEIQLCEGQVCVLDKDVPHSIAPLGEDDILESLVLKINEHMKCTLRHYQNVEYGLKTPNVILSLLICQMCGVDPREVEEWKIKPG
nr:AraC family ligand binding domain-containing protein [Paenibacillus sp. 1-18]